MSSNFITLIFIVAAVFVFFQLRNVLGKRTGNERPPFDPYQARKPVEKPEGEESTESDNVITLPSAKGADIYREIDKVAKPGSATNKNLRAIRDASPIFNPAEFVKGAGIAYEMIVTAFADGDRRTLKNLLSRDVYEGFAAALDEREAKGETVQTNFVGTEKIEIVGADLKDREAQISVLVISQLVSATRNKAGEVIDGDPEEVAEVRDVWTFARDINERNPNWKLIGTEADDD